MGNPYFKFKQFTINQQNTVMKVGVDAVLLGAWANPNQASKILDIGTGTGLLSLMLAQKTTASIVAIEIDEDSYLQALENIKASKWASQMKILKTSFQNFVLEKPDQYDFIICNPPYFDSTRPSPNEKRSLARHDQTLGLNVLFSGVNQILNAEGSFLMIYQYNRKDQVLSEAAIHGLFPTQILEIKGNENKIPNRVIIEFSRNNKPYQISQMIVRNAETNDYTNEYKELTKDYYLNFEFRT
jgi:tRNA1Val (adenine37-N6)-methyltransferase